MSNKLNAYAEQFNPNNSNIMDNKQNFIRNISENKQSFPSS